MSQIIDEINLKLPVTIKAKLELANISTDQIATMMWRGNCSALTAALRLLDHAAQVEERA